MSTDQWYEECGRIVNALPLEQLRHWDAQHETLVVAEENAKETLAAYRERTMHWRRRWLVVFSVLLVLGLLWMVSGWMITGPVGILVSASVGAVSAIWLGWAWRRNNRNRSVWDQRQQEQIEVLRQEQRDVGEQQQSFLAPLSLTIGAQRELSQTFEVFAQITSLDAAIKEAQAVQTPLQGELRRIHRSGQELVDDLGLSGSHATLMDLHHLLETALREAEFEQQEQARRQNVVEELRQQLETATGKETRLREEWEELQAFLEFAGQGDPQAGWRRIVALQKGLLPAATKKPPLR